MTKEYPPSNSVLKIHKLWYKDKDAKYIIVNPSIAELRTAGKCFKCKAPWVPRHAKMCKAKQLFSLVLLQDPEGQEKVQLMEDSDEHDAEVFQDAQENPEKRTLKILMHAFQGIVSEATTFIAKIKIGNTRVTTLVDTGSDASLRCQIYTQS